MITPEIAAFVVKEYLLPMFESDGKRLIAKKQTDQRKFRTFNSQMNSPNKLDSSSVNESLNKLMDKDYNQLDIEAPGRKVKNVAGLGGNKTVFCELKLSEILLGDIDIYKEEITKLRERVESEHINNQSYKKELCQAKKVI